MIEEVRNLLDQYLNWLRDRTTLRETGDWVEITTPYLDRHNDCLQIYAQRANGGFILTDDSYILEDLEQSGCKLDSPKRQDLFRMTVNGFGVHVKDKALEVRSSVEDFARRKHNLIQAMLAVNDLFYLASPIVQNLFHEDVVEWLDLSEIRYTPKVKFSGRSGYDHVFDFVIPKSKSHPERILRAINDPSRDAAQSIAFSWMDTKAVRAPDSRAYAMLNDADRKISDSTVEAMRRYEVRPILWSGRDSVFEELAA